MRPGVALRGFDHYFEFVVDQVDRLASGGIYASRCHKAPESRLGQKVPGKPPWPTMGASPIRLFRSVTSVLRTPHEILSRPRFRSGAADDRPSAPAPGAGARADRF